jgi:hypothetical protein
LQTKGNLALVTSNPQPQQPQIDPAGHYVVEFKGGTGQTYLHCLNVDKHPFPTMRWEIKDGIAFVYKMPDGPLRLDSEVIEGPGDGVFVREATAEDMRRPGWPTELPDFLYRKDESAERRAWMQALTEADKAAAIVPAATESGDTAQGDQVLNTSKGLNKKETEQVFNILIPSKQPESNPLDIAGLYSRDDVVFKAVARIGIPTGIELKKAFDCVLPDHKGHNAALYRDGKGRIAYHCFGPRERFYTLGDVMASQAYGEAVTLKGAELAAWLIRLLVEGGILSPAIVNAPALPTSARPALHKVYGGFVLLLGCRWLHTPDAPSPFSWRFASAWCDVAYRHVGDAMKELLASGYIAKAGEIKGRYNATALFLPGTQAEVDRRR